MRTPDMRIPDMRTSAITRRLGSAALALSLLAAPALALGTPEQRAACTADVVRLCSAEFPSVPRVKACMLRDRAKASPACQAVIARALAQEIASNDAVSR